MSPAPATAEASFFLPPLSSEGRDQKGRQRAFTAVPPSPTASTEVGTPTSIQSDSDGGSPAPPNWSVGRPRATTEPAESTEPQPRLVRRTSSFGLEPTLQVLGAGSGGVDELRELLDDGDAQVRWAFLKFTLGSGAFRRQKLLLLHINGAACPAVRRGRANQHHQWVQSNIFVSDAVGAGGPKASVSLSVSSKAEVTAEQLLTRVRPFFVNDHHVGELTIEWSVEETKQIPVQEATVTPGDPSRTIVIPPHESSLLFKDGRKALQAVSDTWGPWNWLLLRPEPKELPLVAGGDGGITEMQECAVTYETEILTGILRLSFGEGRLKRSKHVLLFAVGAKVGVVARGKLPMVRAQMEKVLAKYMHVSCVIESKIEDVTLEMLIEKVRRSAHIDDEVLDGDMPKRKVSSPEIVREEVKEKQPAPPPKVRGQRFKDIPVKEAIKLLHADCALNWGLFGLDEGRP